jgi:predicted nucleotidyltransferase
MGLVRDNILAHAQEIKALLSLHHARDIKVFGSAARAEDQADSDADFLVEFEPGASILDQIHLEHDLRDLLGCSVDVIPLGGLKSRDTHLLGEALSL